MWGHYRKRIQNNKTWRLHFDVISTVAILSFRMLDFILKLCYSPHHISLCVVYLRTRNQLRILLNIFLLQEREEEEGVTRNNQRLDSLYSLLSTLRENVRCPKNKKD